MQISEKAKELAALIRSCPEFLEYKALRDKVYSDETTRALLKEYKKLQMQLQSAYLSGQQADSVTADKMQKLASVLQFNQDAVQYMLAEHRFMAIVGDVYKMIGDAAEVDLSFLTE